MLYAAADSSDGHHSRAHALLESIAAERQFSTDHSVLETWMLLNARLGYYRATRFWLSLRETPLRIEFVTERDLERAEAITRTWLDQTFSLADCTSFAVMERVGCARVATFDDDFAVYRYGVDRRKAFEVLR